MEVAGSFLERPNHVRNPVMVACGIEGSLIWRVWVLFSSAGDPYAEPLDEPNTAFLIRVKYFLKAVETSLDPIRVDRYTVMDPMVTPMHPSK